MKVARKQYIIVAVALLGIGAYFLFSGPADTTPDVGEKETIAHAHSIAVDITDPERLYIATHHGLLVLENGELKRVGNSHDDFMGFSPHPADVNVFYSSGHPMTGGNAGFLRSSDGGVTWQIVSPGENGPVDFHSMAISPVDPQLMYGWYQRALQRSIDGGKTWQIIRTAVPEVIAFAPHPKNADILFAVTIRGMYISNDRGGSWSETFPALRDSAVTAFAVDPKDDQKMLSFSRSLGLAASKDGGVNWLAVSEKFASDIVLYIAYSKTDPLIVYAMTQKNGIYKSTDGGAGWKKIY